MSYDQKKPEFASFAGAYPSTAADNLVCALALELIVWRENITSNDHLDALILATHPELCRIFVAKGSTAQLDSWAAGISTELKAINTQGLKWVQCLAYLEEHRNAVTVGRNEAGRPIRAGQALESVRQSFSTQHSAMTAFALNILDSLREQRQKNNLSDEQTVALKTMEELHTKYAATPSIIRNRKSAQAWCGSHECAVPGCPELISHKLLMCPDHWRQVPKPIQRVVWATWNAMNDGTGSYEAYQSARAAAIRSVEGKP